jgi:FkbM family methyltransferase
MKQLLIKIYRITPNWLRDYIGKITWLRGFRDIFLKQHGTYREVNTNITKSYEKHDVDFEFYASIKYAAKASRKGIENTLLTNSFKILNTYTAHNNNCTIFDIGANFGYLSLVWGSSLCKNNGNVYAFEPNQNVYNSLLKSITKNNLGSIIKVEHKAVGSENKMVDIFLNNTTSNTIKSDKANNVVQVEMIALDSYCKENNINNCDLVKIDVDGVELSVLKGSIETIINFKPIFIVETNNDNLIIEFFKTYNYRILDMKLEEYLPTDSIPLNIFCIPNK